VMSDTGVGAYRAVSTPGRCLRRVMELWRSHGTLEYAKEGALGWLLSEESRQPEESKPVAMFTGATCHCHGDLDLYITWVGEAVHKPLTKPRTGTAQSDPGHGVPSNYRLEPYPAVHRSGYSVQGALGVIQHHVKAKNVPSNLFTFAPHAYAEEKGVSRRSVYPSYLHFPLQTLNDLRMYRVNNGVTSFM
jgi:hypothetical protein